MVTSSKQFYEFGAFQADVYRRLLLRDGQIVSLTPKAFDTLLVLIENRGDLLEKDQLMEKVWPDTIVEENNLSQNISALRRALGENRNEHQFIVTVPGRGYRFVAEVKESWKGLTPTTSEVAVNGKPSVISNEPAHEPVIVNPVPVAVPVVATSNPRRGWQPSRELLMIFAMAVVLGALLFYLSANSKPRPNAVTVPIKSMAVLPFKQIKPDTNDEYLGVGLADALITRLSNIRQIAVRPTSAVLQFTDPVKTMASAGHDLDVDALLEGTYQRSGDRIRVNVQLVSVRDGAPLWADKYDEQFTNIFAVQDTISERVARALALKLTSEEQQLLTKRFTENPDAYQAYLKGRYYWNKRTSASLEDALKFFQQAKDIDPSYALAYAGLADTYVVLGHRYDSAEDRRDAFPKAKIAAAKALQLNDMLAEAHNSLAVVKQRYDWDWEGAERDYKRALELNPNYPTAHQMYSGLLGITGRLDESLAQIKLAQELDPLSYSINLDLGQLYYYRREFDKAIDQLHATLKISPDDPYSYVVHRYLAWAYLDKNMNDDAVNELIAGMRVQGTSEAVLLDLKRAYDASGLKGYWRRWLEMEKDRIDNRRFSPFYLACIYACLGESDQVLRHLHVAYEDKSVVLMGLKYNPRFDYLRGDPRFQTIVKEVGLTN